MRAILVLLLSASLLSSDVPAPSAAGFAKPHLFARHFNEGPRIPLAGDFDGDGYADLACVFTPGGGIVDVSLSYRGWKPRAHVAVARSFGADPVACAVGELLPPKGADIAVLLADGRIRIVHSYRDKKMTVTGTVARVAEVEGASLLSGDFDGDGKVDLLVVRAGGSWSLLRNRSEGFRSVETEGVRETRKVVSFPGGLALLDRHGRLFRARLSGARWVPALLDKKEGIENLVSGDFLGNGKPDLLVGSTLLASGTFCPTVASLPAPFELAAADFTGDGADDLVCFRKGGGPEGRDILLLVAYRPGATDSDADGLSDRDERRHGSDPLHRDTDGDGLLDGWEVHGAFGFDFAAEGFSPTRKDVLCYVQRRNDVDARTLRAELERAKEYFASLPARNPDPKEKGIGLHFRYLGVLDAAATKGKGWRELGEANLPREVRGLAHYMVISNGGGGQAALLGTMGGCGNRGLYAVFRHEFGHQLGLDHTGGFAPAWCPLYPSIMNYAYNYKKGAGYSTGRFSSRPLVESDLEERLPYPYDQVAFLADPPYRFRLKADGKETLIDWNRNGIFDRGKVVADINTAYSTQAGKRSVVGKTAHAPTFAVRGERAWLFSIHPKGRLQCRTYAGNERWSRAIDLGPAEATGDPFAVDFLGRLFLFLPTASGVVWYEGPSGDKLVRRGSLPDSRDREVSAAPYRGVLQVFLWSRKDKSIHLLRLSKDRWASRAVLPISSEIVPGAVEDPLRGDLLLGIAENQGRRRSSRWRVVRLGPHADSFRVLEKRWVQGKKGGARGNRRCLLLFETGRNAGPEGRIHFISTGLVKGNKGRACVYDAMSVGDRTHDDGWLLKRYYDEWTQTDRAPAVAWYRGDILLAFRKEAGAGAKATGDLTLAHRGLGIQTEPMGDRDDVTHLSQYGLPRSILWMAGP